MMNEPNLEKKQLPQTVELNENQRNKTHLTKILIEFLQSLLEVENLHAESRLSDLGVESITYLELSDFLLEEHGIESNPSRFYGATTVSDLTDYVLENVVDMPTEKVLSSQPTTTTISTPPTIAITTTTSSFNDANLEEDAFILLVDSSVVVANKLREALEQEVVNIQQDTIGSFYNKFQERVLVPLERTEQTNLLIVYRAEETTLVHQLLQRLQQTHPKLAIATLCVADLSIPHFSTLLETLEVALEEQTYQFFQLLEQPNSVTPPITPPKTCVITGGMGAIGQIFANYVSQEWNATTILLGRSSLSAEKQAILQQIKGAVYVSCDLSDRNSLAKALEDIRATYGSIDGVIHCAGVLGNTTEANKDKNSINQVLNPKVDGTRYLDDLTQKDPLQFFVMTSSVSANLIGMAGLKSADYAAANAYLDAFSSYRNELTAAGKRTGLTRSIIYPHWETGGMDVGNAAIKWMKDQFGMQSIPADLGIEGFVQALSDTADQLLVLFGDKKKMLQTFFPEFSAKPTKQAPSTAIAGDSTHKVATYLKNGLCEILKVPQEEMDETLEFMDYGVDSIIAVEIINYFEKDFGTLPKTLLFEFTNLEELTEYFCEKHADKVQTLWQEEAVDTPPIAMKEQQAVMVNKPLTPRLKQVVPRLKQAVSVVTKAAPPVQNQPIEVAIVGIAGLFPNATNPEELWKNIVTGKLLNEGLTQADPFWNRLDQEEAALNFSKFPTFEKAKETFNRQERLVFGALCQVMDRMELQEKTIRGTKTGVFLGLQQDFSPKETGNGLAYLIPNKLSFLLNLKGPSEMVNTYCSSVYVAVHRAIQSMKNGECEQAFVGGANIINPSYPTYEFGSNQTFDILSANNTTKSFDSRANGFVRSEGAGMMLLKPLAKAEADGDTILGIIKGSYVHHGGKNLAFEAPSAKGIKETIKGCLLASNIPADTIDYVEAHGIANPTADAIELSAIDSVYKKQAATADKKWHISTIKPTVGHSELASGMASLIKVLKAFEYKHIPGIPGLEQVNEELDPNHFLILSDTNQYWQKDKHPRRASLNGYSVGGVNAHLILEEYPIPEKEEKKLPTLPTKQAGIKVTAPKVVTPTVQASPSARAEILSFVYNVFNLTAVELDLQQSPIDYDFDSIKITQFVRKVNTHFGIKVKLGQLLSVDDFESIFVLFETAIQQKGEQPVKAEKKEEPITTTRYPLSEGQKGLWIIQEADKAETVYNVPVALELVGDISPDLIYEIAEKLLERHPVLRAVFGVDEESGELFQEVSSATKHLTRDVQVLEEGQVIEEVFQQLIRQSFDLSQEVLRLHVRTHPETQKTYLLFVIHHIVFDGMSVSHLGVEYIELMERVMASNNAITITPNRRFFDFIKWEADYIQSEEGKEDVAYWKQRLQGNIEKVKLTYDTGLLHDGATKGMESRNFEGAALEALKAAAKSHKVSLSVFLLSVFKVLLYRLSGTEEITVKVPTAGRPEEKYEDSIGYYINIMLSQTELSGATTFANLVQTQRSEFIDSIDHLRYPYPKLLSELQLTKGERDAQFAITFNFVNVFSPILAGNNKQKTVLLDKVHQEITDEYILEIIDFKGELRLQLKYRADLFSKATIERHLDYYQNIVLAVIANPTANIADIDLVSKKEQQQLLQQFNNTAANFPTDKTLVDLFEEQVAKTPNNIAVAYEGKELTYKALNEKANSVAQYLLTTHNIQPDDIIGLQVTRSEWMLVGILGILKAGAAYLPMGPDLPKARVAFMLEDSAAKLLLTDKNSQAVSAAFENIVSVATIEQAATTNANGRLSKVNHQPSNLAYIIYTSGSTGKPKGVMIEHRNVVRLMVNDRNLFDFNEKDVWTLFHYYGFDFSVWEIWGALLFGGKVIVVSKQATLNPEAFADLLLAEQVTVLNQVPSTFDQVQVHLLKKAQQEVAIRYIIFGGAKLIPSTLQEWKTRFPTTRLINMYGITETTVHVTYKEIEQAAIEAGISNVGGPIPTLRCYILDEKLQLAPIGVVGEIYVAGDGLARGYLNNPKLTDERFIDNPFEKGQKLYKSGDSGRWLTNGDIEFFGRIDFQLKIRGFRIEAGEIEQLLLAHPAIQSTIVLGKEINGTTELVAYLTGKEEAMPSLDSLRAYLSKDLPDYMVPAYFVQLEVFPLTKNGKIDRKSLPAPDGLSLTSGVEFIAPRNSTEEKLVAAFSDILGLDAAAISVEDDFFNLGGDSIKLIRLVGQINRAVGIKLPLAKVYAASKVVELADYILQNTQQLATEESKYSQLKTDIEKQITVLKEGFLAKQADSNIEAIFPMSDIQKGMIFGNLLYEKEGVYHDQAVYSIGHIGFEKARFEQALHLMIAKHTTLRTAFQLDYEGKDIQLVYQTIDLPLVYETTENLQKEELELRLASFLKAERQKGFDIKKAGLWRMNIFQSETAQPLLVLQFHHAIFDGWSLASFNTELLKIYHELSKDPAYQPSALSLSYQDFVIRELITKQDDTIRNFWQQELSDYERADLFTAIEIDDEYEINLGDYLKQIEALAAQYEVPVKVLTLSTYLLLLDFLGYQSETVIGIISTNRLPESEGDQLLGCFLNSVPLRVPVDKQATAADFIQQVADKIKALRGNDQLTTMEIARLIGETSASGNPIFDVIFNYIDFHIYDDLEDIGWKTERMLQAELTNIPTFFERTNTFFDLMVNTTGNELTLKVQLSRQLKAGYSAKDLFYKYLGILDSLRETPTIKIGDLSFLNTKERQQLLHQFNPTSYKGQAVYNDKKTVVDLFIEQAAKTPHKTALVFDGHTLTYEELEKRSRQLALYLQEQGVQTDTLVGLCMNRSLEMMVAILGILRAGGAYVPLDPDYPKDRVVYMLEDGIIKGNKKGDAKIIITQEALKPLVTDNIDELDITLLALSDNWASNEPIASIEGTLTNKPAPEDLIYVIFTSGSTGKPKGTLVKHQGFYNLMHWYLHDFNFQEDSKFLLVSSINFDLTQKNLYAPLALGGSLYMSSAEHYDLATITGIMQAEGITNINCTPSIFYGYVEAATSNQFKALQSLEYVFLGGEPINLPKLDAWFNNPLNKAKLVNSYGPTECSDVVSDYTIEDSKITTIPVGKPICNTQLYVLDASQNLVPIGVQGELCIGGKGIGRGYLNNPTLTKEKFIANPFKTGELLYKTGDVARTLPDGNIEFLGRADHQLKIRGHRIEAGEIEEVLQKNPAVHSAIVMGKEIADSKELVAYLVAGDKKLPELEQLRSYLSERLPDYMVPAYFVEMEALPLTPSGKVNRRALPEPAANSMASSVTYVAPRTRTESILARIWEDLLQQPNIGIYDNFFNLGGHSLKAVRLVAAIQAELSVAIKLSEVFSYPTIAALAPQLSERGEQQLVAIEPVALAEHYALSNAQNRLWLTYQIEDNQTVYNMPMALRLTGKLNVQALRVAFEQLVDRHEILRTNIITIDGHPRQLIHPVGQFEMPLIQSTAATDLSSYILNFAQRPFDIAKEVLLRLELLQLSEKEHLLLFNTHHIAFDGWSMGILLAELNHFYKAYLYDTPATLPALTLQYKEYAAWQNTLLEDETLMADLRRYWLQKLAPTADGMPVLALPTDFPRPAVQTFDGTIVSKTISKKIVTDLEKISQSAGATLSMTLTALVKVLLYRYSNQRDIVIGMPSAGRIHPSIEEQLGFYVNTLVLRDTLTAGIHFADFLQQVKQTSIEAIEHELYPFDRLVADLNLTRDLSRSPLFDVLIAFQDYDATAMRLNGATLSVEAIDWQVSKFDLSFGFTVGQEGLTIDIEYNTNLYKAARIERMFDHLECLMEGVITNIHQPIEQLNILPKQERIQLVETFATAKGDYDFDKTIHQLFEEQVERTPNKIALVFEDKELTYQDLNNKANQLAHYLITHYDIKGDDIIALQVERSEWMLIALLGIMKAGGAYLPLAPDYPINRTAFMLQDSAARLLLTDATTNEKAQSAFKEVLPIIAVEKAQSADKKNPITVTTCRNLSYIIYTSGSTGQPKGVMLEHRGVVNMLISQRIDLEVTAADTTLLFAPYTFDASVPELFMGLSVGAKMVITSRENLLSIETFKALMLQHQVTLADIPPSYLAVLNEAILAQVRLLITAGEAAISKDVKKYSSQLQYVNIYGPTENSVVASSFKIPANYEVGQSVPIGRPIANTSIFIVDDQFQLVPIGVPGEIVVGGVGLARGYLNNPSLTASKFVPLPIAVGNEQGERLYRTGDLGCWLDDGNIAFLGRIDHQLKIRGHRIEAGEIEDQLLQHPTIQSAVVIGKAINGTKELIAYIVATKEASLSVADLRGYLAEALPDYMIPTYFVVLGALPLTSHDKVDRKALPVPDSTNTLVSDDYAAPQSELEKLLVQVWEDILNRPKIGIHDNFFHIGGDSIKALQISGRLGAQGYALPIKELFLQPTIAQLANSVTTKKQDYPQGILSGTAPLTAIQEWFFETIQTEQHHFNQAFILASSEKLNPVFVAKSLEAILAHHDLLRATYTEEDGTPIQTIEQAVRLDFQTIDLQEVADPASIIATHSEKAQAGFDLTNGPLLKAILFKKVTGDKLLIVIHHLAVDGVSWRILLEDLNTAYQQLATEQPIRLAPKTAPFAWWAKQLQDYANSLVGQEHYKYWSQVVDRPIDSLVVDDLTKSNSAGDSATIEVQLNKAQTQRLLAQTHQAYQTEINDVLLCALSRALQQVFGGQTYQIILEGHGREAVVDMDISRTVGWFTSAFPVVLDFTDNLGAHLQLIKETVHRIPNKGMDYGVLRYLSNAAVGDIAENAISFNYLGAFSNSGDEAAVLHFSDNPVGASSSPKLERDTELDVNGIVLDNQLQLSFTYGSQRMQPAKMQALATAFKQQLVELIDHCAIQTTPQLTPVDFTACDLNLEQYHQFLQSNQLVAADLEDIYTLSPLQEGMLFHKLMTPDTPAYFNQVEFTIKTDLDIPHFKYCWEQIIQAHPVLRTSFHATGLPKPLQVVHKKVALQFFEKNIAELTPSEQEQLIEDYVLAERAKGFDLSQPSLLRVALFQIDAAQFKLLISDHHITMDGWSQAVLLQDLKQLYRKELHVLPSKPFSPYIAWLNEQSAAESDAFWTDYLKGYEATAVVPKLTDRAATEAMNNQVEILELSEAKTSALEKLAKNNQVSLNTVIQAIWAVVLGTYNQQTVADATGEVVFGVTTSGRSAPIKDIEQLSGLFINTIPLRVTWSAADTFIDLLATIQRSSLAIQEYEHASLAQIQKTWQGQGELIDHIIAFENFPETAKAQRAGDLNIEHTAGYDPVHYDFGIVVAPSKSLTIQLKYNQTAISSEWIQHIKGHILAAINTVLAQPKQLVRTINMIPTTERQLLLQDFNDTQADFPKDKTIIDLFEEQVAKTPNNIAVVFENTSLTYQELNEKANCIAYHLQRQHYVQPDDIIGLQVKRSESIIIGILGILKAGAAYLPMGTDLPAARVAYMLKDSKTKLLLTDEQSQSVSATFSDQVSVVTLETLATPRSASTAYRPATLSTPTNLAYIIYTSGSTGKPKGVMIEHRNVVRLMVNDRNLFDFNDQDVWTLFHYYGFDFTVWEIWGALLFGGKLVIVSQEATINPTQFADLLIREKVTVLNQVPSTFEQVQVELLKKTVDTTTLRYIIFGGSKLLPTTLKAWHDRFPYTRLINMYGITETTVHVTYKEIGATEIQTGISNIGQAIPTLCCYILNENLQPVPLGVVGEIYVAGDGLARGYLNNSMLTEERFIPNPFEPGQKLYRSGDSGRWLLNGDIEFFGRIDFQLKIRGFRIEAGEIEQILTSHPAIHSCVVLSKQINTSTELVAYLTAKEAMVLPDIASLRAFLNEAGLPDYMIPSYFVELERMPLTRNGKVNRKALPDPETNALVASAAYVAPRTVLEQELVKIWEQVLEREAISVTDNFFHLGGHSLKAIRLLGQIQEQLQLQLPLQLLFQHPVLAEQAAQLAALGDYQNTYTYQAGVRFNPAAEQTVFTFPPFFGLSAWYQQLAAQMPATSFYCFDFLLEDNRLELYYQQIKKEQPTGPYVLFGYSGGGSLAYEMAAYMEQKGDEIAAVIMGDSMIVSNMKTDLEQYLNDLSDALSTRQDDSAKGLLELIHHKTLRAQSKQRLAAYQDFLNNLKNHAIQASIHLIKAEFEAEIATMHQRWNEYTKGAYQVYQASGSHDYLFEAPNLEANAALLQAIFEESRAATVI